MSRNSWLPFEILWKEQSKAIEISGKVRRSSLIDTTKVNCCVYEFFSAILNKLHGKVQLTDQLLIDSIGSKLRGNFFLFKMNKVCIILVFLLHRVFKKMCFPHFKTKHVCCG